MDTGTPTPAPAVDAARRRLLAAGGAAAAAPLAAAQGGPPARGPAAGRPNIVFVFSDQQRWFGQLPAGLRLPGQERLAREGTTFRNHYCPAVMCTSSRAVMLTGLQTADNRMFENADMPYVKALSTGIPTIGHMLRGAGYYTAYKGKWHLDAAFDGHDRPDRLFTREMDAYGFSDFGVPIDALAHAHGGYAYDHMTAGAAVSWLRDKGRPMADERKPWALFVSFVNPHDIMYFNTDAPGERVQDTGRLMMHAARAPAHEAYRSRWKAPLPATWREPVDAPGRPRAHAEFDRAWGYTLGHVPTERERWNRFTDYYLNCMRGVDRQLEALLVELDRLGLSRDTIVVFTSDHGEMGGAHGLRGKGPFAYEEAIHLPLQVVHPDVRGGRSCEALTSHVDLVPSLLAMAGVPAGKVGELAGRELPGRSVDAALGAPSRAGLHAVRDAVLFTYSGLATNDSEVIRIIAEARAAGRNPKEAMKAAGYRPDLKKRGSVRTVFDGRYKFSRYFSPIERNSPRDLDELFRWNDVELFDLKTDPRETVNLAADRAGREPLLRTMNAKLEAAIAAEIGKDDGREMPQVDGIDWAIDRIDL
jgi:arylsulfatase A-like enzyme